MNNPGIFPTAGPQSITNKKTLTGNIVFRISGNYGHWNMERTFAFALLILFQSRSA